MNATALLVPLALCGASLAQTPAPAADMPVRELTAFKDGHAYVLRDAPLGSDSGAQVALDELPQPVLGTFWPFVTGGDARLRSAKAGMEEVDVTRPAVTVLEVARANVGKQVSVEVRDGELVTGELPAIPEHEGAGQVLLVAQDQLVHAVAIDRVRGLTVDGAAVDVVTVKERRPRLVLDVDGGGEGARVGVVYVQRGFRWIPSYRVDLGDDGQASVQLQATLVNDLVDLDGATVNLVVGVPAFAFADMLDPIALQQQTAQVAQAAARAQSQRFSNFLSNSLTTQVAGYGAEAQNAPAATGPEVGDAEAAEDLFVFPVQDVTLAKGGAWSCRSRSSPCPTATPTASRCRWRRRCSTSSASMTSAWSSWLASSPRPRSATCCA